MKKLTTLSILFISLAFITPIQVSAATSAGVKPGNFFYFFDTASEKINLFFTFNPEKKAQQALEYADERLAEAEESANENNPKAVEKAMTGYKEEISLATEESKGLKDEERAKELLNTVSENTAKHQEVLAGVLEKVPEEAKQAILNAIEISKKGQEEATKQIDELKNEIERLKKEVEGLKKESSNPQVDEVEKLKKEVEELKKKQGVIQSITKQINTEVEANKVISTVVPTTPQSEERKTSTVTFPNGSIAEIDEKGNVVRWIKEVPQQTYISSTPAQAQVSTSVQISSINVTTTVNSARIEWQTETPATSKVFFSGGGFFSKVYDSESGLSTRHIVNITGLSGGTNYSYEIEAISGNQQVVKKVGSFTTNAPKPDEYTISVQPDKISVPASGWHSISIKVSTLKNGQSQYNQNVSMTTPDSSQNRSSTNGNNIFTYSPKTVGVHKLEFSWNGVTKSVEVQATSYEEIKPSIANFLDNNAIIPLGTTGQVIGSFTVTSNDELVRVTRAIIDSTSSKNLIGFWNGPISIGQSSGSIIVLESGITSSLEIRLRLNEATEIGKYSITINSIEMIGNSSGMTHTASGLPITFNYEVI